MSRPRIVGLTGASIKIEAPAGWYTTISVISRKQYNQLVTVEYQLHGQLQRNHIANAWGQIGQVMKDIDNKHDNLAINPQDAPLDVEFNVYYSTQEAVSGKSLRSDEYRSARTNIITTNRPLAAANDLPDYTTYLIFVEDALVANRNSGASEGDDSIITVNLTQGSDQGVPSQPDIISRAIAEKGKHAINEFIGYHTDPTTPGPTIPIPPTLPPRYPAPPQTSTLPVCILGAGAAGLYIAMMLDSLGINYDLMEGSGRTGGRIFTYHFPKNPDKFQYFDAGAMRFPDTSFMKRTFDLARNRLGLTPKMLPYIRNTDAEILHYNGISVPKLKVNSNPGLDYFNFSESNGGNIPDEYVKLTSTFFWDNILGELRQLFVDYPFDVAYNKLIELDGHSVTSYLTFVKKVPFEVIKWYETLEDRTGIFDEGLTETVLASLAFIDPRFEGEPFNWFCFEGGSEIVTQAMEAQIKHKSTHYQRAVAVRETDDGASLTVTFDHGHNPRPASATRTEKKYSNVISTMSLGCLRMVDLDQLYLSDGQRNALRELAYGPSIKVGIQFKSAWWEKLGIIGGQSSSDLPIRDVIYPSYGPDVSRPNNAKSTCLIASYNGMQDAQRLGGLMKGRDTPEERVLLDLVMRDLAKVHNKDVKEIWDEFEDYFPYDHYRDEFKLGAFCQFGPGQFKYTYPHLTHPASKDQRFHFAGEGTSAFHGWVAGALNSGWRVVLGLLLTHPELNPNPSEDIVEKFKRIWGPSEEWDDKQLAKHTYVTSELAKLDLAGRKATKVN